MIETTPEQTLQYLREAVAARGEHYVYPEEWKMYYHGEDTPTMCKYVTPDGSGPACIVGVVLHKYGVSLETLTERETQAGWRVAHELGADYVSRQMLSAAQHAQDAGDSWGSALRQAESERAFDQRLSVTNVQID